jgi:hypothetical protein
MRSLVHTAKRIAAGELFTWSDVCGLVDATVTSNVHVQEGQCGDAIQALIVSLAALKAGMTAKHRNYERPHPSATSLITSRRTNCPDLSLYVDKFCSVDLPDGSRVMVRLMQADLLSNGRAKQFYYDNVSQS